MKFNLFKAGNRVINGFFALFIGLTVIFAIISPNLTVGDNKVFGTSTSLAITYFVLGAIALLIALYCYPKVQRFFSWIFIKHRYWAVSVFVGLVLIWQIIFVWFLHPAIGWDVSAIHDGLTDTTSSEMVAYFSLNQNNLPILLWQHQLAEWFSTTSWLFFDYVTLLLVDLAVLLNLLTVRLLNKKYLLPAIYLHGLWLLVFPWLIVPYTDTWVLPFVSGCLFFYSCLINSEIGFLGKVGSSVGLGIVASLGYFIKPSALIPVIAILIIEVLSFFAKKWQFKGRLLVLAITLVTAAGTYAIGNYQLQNQDYIAINKERAIPMIHFMNIGMTGDGGYSAEDALEMAKLPTKEARVEYSKEQIVERLKERGFFGYLGFLFKKHQNNTADGTFAWLKEGSFIQAGEKPNGKGFTRWLQDGYYLYGERIANFRFIAQVWWVLCLLIIVLGWKQQEKFKQMLRLSLVGGFMFLLIFEGGRSRYLIQFLPIILLLASLSVSTSINVLKRVFTIEQPSKGEENEIG
jgi:integral membrane protein (TIGR03766 family)